MKESLKYTALLLLATTSLSSATPVTQIKVMSFNIWVSGGDSLSQCIDAINTSGADLVGLQECNAATAQTIATSLGFYVLPAGDCSIVSRYPILSSQVIGNSRGVTVELSPGQRAHLFNCHLAAYPYGPYWLKDGSNTTAIINLENTARTGDLNQLLAAMQPSLAGPEPVFLVGDFNAPSHLDYTDFNWPTSIACTNAGLGDSYHELHPTNRKFPAPFTFDEPGVTWTPKTNQEPEGVFDRIDFVYYSRGDGANPTNSTELDHRNGTNPWPSDHRAVITTFAITPYLPPAKATLPSPAHQAIKVQLNPTLNWLPGNGATNHAVYLGTTAPGQLLTNTTQSSIPLASLLPETTYYWRVDEASADGVTTGDAWSFTTKSTNAVIYEWTFDQGNLSPALGSGTLTYADGPVTSNLTTFGTSDGVAVPHLAGKPVTYLHAPAFTEPGNGYLASFTDSGPNGGGSYINQFTMIFDVLLPGSLGWFPFFNTNPSNGNDADFYAQSNGSIGIAAIGYSPAGVITANSWYRVAFAADLVAGTVKYYINGNPVFTGSASLDGRHSLYSNLDSGPDLLLFNEGETAGTYTHAVYLSSFAFTDRTLSAAEILALGAPVARGIFVPPPPVTASIGWQGASLLLTWAGGNGTYQVQRKSALQDADWQNVGTATSQTNLTVTPSGVSGFYRILSL